MVLLEMEEMGQESQKSTEWPIWLLRKHVEGRSFLGPSPPRSHLLLGDALICSPVSSDLHKTCPGQWCDPAGQGLGPTRQRWGQALQSWHGKGGLGTPALHRHHRGLGQGGHKTEAKAVLEMLLCPVALFGWNHKPQSKKHRCAVCVFFFFDVFFLFYFVFLLSNRGR